MRKAKTIKIFPAPHVEISCMYLRKWKKISRNATSQKECIVAESAVGAKLKGRYNNLPF